MRPTNLILILAFLAAVWSCERNDEPDFNPKQLNISSKTAQVISNSNDFGIELFTKTAAEEQVNLMLSPLSASTAITMLLNGCGGNTFTQIKAMLRYPNEMTIADVNTSYNSLVTQLLAADSKVTLKLANAIFYKQNYSIKPTFLNAMSTDFSARVQGLDMSVPSSVSTINQWASDNTNGKITKIIDEIDANTVMFIMNALYFKGNWSIQFNKDQTSNRPFTFDNGSFVSVSTMASEVMARFSNGEDYNAIELPYGRSNFTMVLVVPTKGIANFIAQFNGDLWSDMISDFESQSEFSKVQVYLPKFKFSYQKVLNDQLKSMGMTDAFNGNANLSGISDASLYVNMVKQNTFVDVNEEGTEAAAVTVIDMRDSAIQPSVFRVDKPFIFAIRERTSNTLLFIGQVYDPRS
jgi:serpin B